MSKSRQELLAVLLGCLPWHLAVAAGARPETEMRVSRSDTDGRDSEVSDSEVCDSEESDSDVSDSEVSESDV